MGKFYTDDQIQEVIAALESKSPGIWENMKRMVSITDALSEEQETELTAITRVFSIVFPEVSFVAQADDKSEATARLSIDLGNAVRAAAASSKDAS